MRADLLDRLTLVCPACTWKKGHPAALRLERGDAVGGEIRDGALRCVKCSEQYPILQGVAVLVVDGWRRVAAETQDVEDPVRLAGPHLLAHFGDLLPEGDRAGLRLGDCWPRLGELPVDGVAVDLACSLGRAVRGLARRAAFALGCESSFVTARLARSIAAAGRAPVRLVEEGTRSRTPEADLAALGGGDFEFVVADPDLPPVAPGRASLALAAHCLERQQDPQSLLRRADALLAPGGRLAVCSPWTFWEDTGPKGAWPVSEDAPVRETLARFLATLGHSLESDADLLLVLREHARLEQVVRPQLLVFRREGRPRG
jgi:SAM-dependent methyltransferase